MKRIIYLAIASVLSFSSLIAQTENSFKTKWDNGYKISDINKQFSMKFGGRIMWDNAFFFQSEKIENKFGKIDNGTEFRRLRFFNAGTIYNNVDYKLSIDFAGSKIVTKDAYITLKKIGVLGNLRVGHFKEPHRLEALSSSKTIVFMERSFSINMTPERNTGFMFFNDMLSKKLSWQVGIFRRSDSAGNDKKADDGYVITSRLTGLMLGSAKEDKLIHVGASYSYRNPKSNEFNISANPETHLSNKYVTTGTISDVAHISIFNLESSFVFGPLSFQAEYMDSEVMAENSSNKSYSFNSYYAQASYFLTKEHRIYKSSLSGFDRVIPNKNFSLSDKTYGAWEIALRYSSIDMDSNDLNGGQLTDVTLGLNWYLNPATRIMANYIIADLNKVGMSQIVQLRFQIDF